MQKLTEKQLLGIIIGVFVVIAGGIGYYAYHLYSGELQKKIQEKSGLEARIQELRLKLDELNKLRAQKVELEKMEAEYAEILPSAQQVTRGAFISMLAGFEQQAGVAVSELTQKAAKATTAPGGAGGAKPAATAASPFETVEFKFTVKGGFFDVVHFMYLIESHKRLMKIVDGDITPEAASASAAATTEEARNRKTPCTLNLTVATYVYSQPTKTAPAAGPPGPGGGS